MTVYTWDFEGGTNGAAFTGPTAVESTFVYSNAHPSRGSMGGAIITPGTGSGIARQSTTDTKVTLVGYFSMYGSMPSGDLDLMYLTAPGDASCIRARVNGSGGAPRLVISRDTTVGPNAWTGSSSLALSTVYRLGIYAEAGTSTTTGKARMAIYAGDSTTALHDSGLMSGVNVADALAAFLNIRFGKCSSGNMSGSVYWDDVKILTGVDATNSFPPSNLPPVVTVAPTTTVTAGAGFSIPVTATDDGTIASYAWTVITGSSTATPTLTGASTATVTGTAPAAGNLVTLQCVVTDNGGLTTTVTTELRVPTSGNFTTLNLPGTGATWTNTGGAANDGTALSDGSDTTYSESPTYTITESERRWRLQPLTTRSTLVLTPRSQVSATGGTTYFRLYEGNTLRQQWALTQNTTITDQAVTVSTPTAITDWGNLWVAWSGAS